MAFCSNCGAQAQGAFCPNCGTPIGSSSAGSSSAAGASSTGPGAYTPPPGALATSGIEPHIAGALCYTPFAIGLIASIIFILVSPYNQNKFVRFNAFQSLFLHLGLFVLGIVVGLVFGILASIIHVFALLLLPLYPLLWISIIILFLYMMYKSFNNQKVVLPFVGEFAEKQS